MSGVVWEDPPFVRSAKASYGDFADELRQNPKRWARLPTDENRKANGGDANAIKTGRFTAFRPAGHFEATFRQGVTYVRYVGETAS